MTSWHPSRSSFAASSCWHHHDAGPAAPWCRVNAGGLSRVAPNPTLQHSQLAWPISGTGCGAGSGWRCGGARQSGWRTAGATGWGSGRPGCGSGLHNAAAGSCFMDMAMEAHMLVALSRRRCRAVCAPAQAHMPRQACDRKASGSSGRTWGPGAAARGRGGAAAVAPAVAATAAAAAAAAAGHGGDAAAAAGAAAAAAAAAGHRRQAAGVGAAAAAAGWGAGPGAGVGAAAAGAHRAAAAHAAALGIRTHRLVGPPAGVKCLFGAGEISEPHVVRGS